MKITVVVLLVVYIAAQTTALKHSNFRSSASLSRTRRQTSNEDTEKCEAIASRARCTSSNAQNSINAFSKCGVMGGRIINSTENSCRRNSNGQYCGEISNRYVYGNCSGGSCPSGCSQVLMDGGCCLDDGFGSFDMFFTACGMPPPTQCAKSGLQIPTITDDNSCSTDDGFNRLLFLTNCDNSLPILNALERDGTCPDTLDNYRDLCASRNDQYCRVELNATIPGGDSAGLSSLASAAASCPSTSSCSSACNSSLNALVTTVGCCFQSANNTNNFPLNFNPDIIFNSSLWNTCNVPLVTPCGAPPMYDLYISIIVLMASFTLLLQIGSI